MNTNRTWHCPYCDSIEAGDNRFKTHLKKVAGHGLAEDDVEFVMRKVLLGLKVPTLEELENPPDDEPDDEPEAESSEE